MKATARVERVDSTRDAILAAAERLFAEQGLASVSNRQVSAAAGQGNNTAVNYHFGTKADLVRAIVRKHHVHTEQLCRDYVSRASGSTEIEDWVRCLVYPVTEHLASLGEVTWYARFSAQLESDPVYRELFADESLVSKSVQRIIDGLHTCLPEAPSHLRRERNMMARLLIVHTCAERERARVDYTAIERHTWEQTASGLVDAITGLYLAPVTARK